MLDQNTLPKHSFGEDWGKNNFQKAYVAMKNFQILPLDTTIANTENALSQQHFQVMNLEQTNRMMSRIQMANYLLGNYGRLPVGWPAHWVYRSTFGDEGEKKH